MQSLRSLTASPDDSKEDFNPKIDHDASTPENEQIEKLGDLRREKPTKENIRSFLRFVHVIRAECEKIEAEQEKSINKTGFVQNE